MLYSLWTDYNASQVQCGECLCRIICVSGRSRRLKENVTLFFSRALAICCTPWSPISLELRSSVVSVYLK
jgi:hypothetical protein